MTIFRLSLLGAVLFATTQAALAQQPIGAGGQIQQIPSPPVPERSPPVLPIPRQAAPPTPVAPGATFAVRSLHITGQTRYSEAELIEATDFKPDSTMTLHELRTMAWRITNYYNQHVYFVARAYLPPQDITDGNVTIAVIEGHYGKVNLNNRSNVSNGLLGSVLDGVNTGDLVATDPLERRLLIISDMPGINVDSTLAPGTAVGTSDLTVGVTQGPRIDGSVEADNWGNPYTGTYRVGGTINYNEPLGLGDVLSLRTLDSTDGGMYYGRASYQAQVQDATVGVALTGFRYHLSKQFTPLDANGSEEIASIYASYPLIRSYDNNLNLLGDFDERLFQDNIGISSTSARKRASVVIVGINGDHHDMFGGGGWTNYYVAGTFGDLDIETAAARAADAATARTNGAYAKLSASVSRLQHLFGPLSVYGAIRGQVASKNLDISEKMELGGATGVRAYPEGEAYGDQGYIATVEPRLLLPTPANWLGQIQLIAFVDTGYVTVSKTPFTAGNNGISRTGAGAGFIWSDTDDFVVTATYAHSIDGNTATSYPVRSGQVWVQLTKFF